MRVSRPFSRLVVTLIAASALLAPGAVASAKTNVAIGGLATPPILDFTTTPRSLTATVDIDFTSDVPGELPGTISKITIFITRGARLNGALFPSCDPKRLARMRGRSSACPAGSRIGSGLAVGGSPQFMGVRERLKMDVYNGPGGRSILFYLQGLNPVALSGMINARLTPQRSGRWGYKLALSVPDSLQEISPGVFASVLHIQTKLGATVRVRENGRMVRHGYIEALACPPGALVPLSGLFGFRDGASATADGYLACGRR